MSSLGQPSFRCGRVRERWLAAGRPDDGRTGRDDIHVVTFFNSRESFAEAAATHTPTTVTLVATALLIQNLIKNCIKLAIFVL